MIKVAAIASKGGSVIDAVLRVDYVRDRIGVVLSDRKCAAIDKAQAHGIATKIHETDSPTEFSDWLLKYFDENPHDLVLSFYTQLFQGALIDRMYGSFVNFHPSILPACPGMDGFGDTLASGSLFCGATAHLVDNEADTGFPLVQCALPLDPSRPREHSRHDVFISQCRMLIQLIEWFEDARFAFDGRGRPLLRNACYSSGPYSPNLESERALKFLPD